MEITIIIPVRNRASILPATLQSIECQTRRPDRVIIVVNDSTDATEEVARRWADSLSDMNVDIVVIPEKGASKARNVGLDHIDDGRDCFVMFFDSDDLMLPDHIQRIAAELERKPETDLLYFDRSILSPEGWTEVRSVAGDAPLIRSQIFHSILGTTQYAASLDLIRRAGRWDECLPRWNDYEYGLRLAVNARSPRKLCGEPRVIVRPQPDSITSPTFSQDAPSLTAALDAMGHTLAEAQLRHDLSYLRARRAILAALFAREGHHELSRPLMSETISSAPSLRDKAACRLAYLVTRLTGRGGGATASLLLRPKRVKDSDKTSRLKR